MKTFSSILLSIIVSLCLFSPVWSQSSSSGEDGALQRSAPGEEIRKDRIQEESGEYESVVQLDGLPLVTESGEQIGTMRGVKADKESGKIHFFTYTRSDGNGEKTGKLPYGSFMLESDRAVLVVAPEKLRSAPEQEQATDEQYMRDLQTYYGLSPVWSDDQGGTAGDAEQ